MEKLDLKFDTLKELTGFLYSCANILAVTHDRSKNLLEELKIEAREISPFGFAIEWDAIANHEAYNELAKEIGKDRDLLLLNQIKLFKSLAPKRQERTERRKSFLRGGINCLENELKHCEQTEESRAEILKKIEKATDELKTLE